MKIIVKGPAEYAANDNEITGELSIRKYCRMMARRGYLILDIN